MATESGVPREDVITLLAQPDISCQPLAVKCDSNDGKSNVNNKAEENSKT